VAEDWRVTITVDDRGQVEPLLKQLHEHPLEQQLAPGVAGRVAVSADENKVFLYADTRWTAEAAERVVMELAADQGVHAQDQLDRWHPIEERWEDGNVSLPEDDDDVQRERERLDEEETADSQESGFASWEVRIEFSSHRDASAFADRAETEGQPIVRRWKYVILGANDEDDARALAEQLQNELPDDATIHVEPGTGTAWEWLGDRPFAVFGGLSA